MTARSLATSTLAIQALFASWLMGFFNLALFFIEQGGGVFGRK